MNLKKDIMNYLKTVKLLLMFTFMSVNSFSQSPIKRVLVEESTGTWCASCAYGSIYFEHLEDNYPNAIPVAVHTGPGGQDPMAILSVELYMSGYFGGSPTFLFDRKDFPENPSAKPAVSASSPWSDGLNTLDSYMDQIYNQSPLATVGIDQTYNSTTREITVTITSNFVQNTTGNFRLNCMIVEDGVTGDADYDQANSNFSGWTGGPSYLQPLIDESHPIVGYVHNHVLRSYLGNPEGATASIPTTVASGSGYSKTFTYTLPAEFDENKILLIGLVQRFGSDVIADREIVNANSQHLDLEGASVNEQVESFIDISIFPNPLTENSTIEFYVKNSSTITCELISSTGEIVNLVFNKHFTQGEYRVDFKNLDLSNGIYFLKFNNSEKTTIKKLVVNM